MGHQPIPPQPTPRSSRGGGVSGSGGGRPMLPGTPLDQMRGGLGTAGSDVGGMSSSHGGSAQLSDDDSVRVVVRNF
jgi:hypothetical protein